MWPFKSKKDDPTLEETKREIDSRIRKLEGEWDDTYERFRLLYARLSKRVKQLDQAPETETAQRVGGDEAAQPATSLSARQQELNARILARRQRGGNGGLLHG